MSCFTACFGFPKRSPVIDASVVNPNPLECQAVPSRGMNCAAAISMSRCEPRASVASAWVATSPTYQRPSLKAQEDAVDAFDAVMSACVQLRSGSFGARSAAAADTEPSAGAAQPSASGSASANYLHPSAGRHARRSAQGQPGLPRPYASASAPIFKIEVPPDSDAWVPAPKQQQAGIAPLLLVDNDGPNSNMELGEFYESMLLSMQIRLKVDAELSSFRHLPSASSNRFIARLSMGQHAGLISAAASATPSGAWQGSGGATLPTNNSNNASRTVRRFDGSLDFPSPASRFPTSSISPSQAAASVMSPAVIDTASGVGHDGGSAAGATVSPQLPLTADCPSMTAATSAMVRALDHIAPSVPSQIPHLHPYVPPYLLQMFPSVGGGGGGGGSQQGSGRHAGMHRSNSIGRSNGTTHIAKARGAGGLRPLQSAELTHGSASPTSRTGTLPSSAEGVQPLSTAAAGGFASGPSEQRTITAQLVSKEPSEGPGGEGLWQEPNLEPAVDISSGATQLPTTPPPLLQAWGLGALLEATKSCGGGGGAGASVGAPGCTGAVSGGANCWEAWGDVSLTTQRGNNSTSATSLLPPNWQGQPSPPWALPPLSPYAVAAAVTAASGAGDSSCGEGMRVPPLSDAGEQQQLQQQPSLPASNQPQLPLHHHQHQHHHHGRQSRVLYNGVVGSSAAARMLRPIPESDSVSASRLHQMRESILLGEEEVAMQASESASSAPSPRAYQDSVKAATTPAVSPFSVVPSGRLMEQSPPFLLDGSPTRAQGGLSHPCQWSSAMQHHSPPPTPPQQQQQQQQQQQPPSGGPPRCFEQRRRQRPSAAKLPMTPSPRSASWYGGAPAVHPDPTRVAPEVPVEMRLCRAAQELLEGLSDVRPLGAEAAADAEDHKYRDAVLPPAGPRPHEQRRPDLGAGARQGAAAAAGGWVHEPLRGPGGGTPGGGGAECRSVVLQGRWQGHPVAVKLMIGAPLDQKNSALVSALAAAAVVHSGLVRVYGVRLLPSGAVGAPECRGLAKAAIAAGEAMAAAVAAASLKPGEGVLAIIMELCAVGSLERLTRAVYSPFRPNRSWPAYMARRALLRTALEVAGALAHLHRYGLAHGGLRPANVLLVPALQDRRKFCAKVADVSLSCNVMSHGPPGNPLLFFPSNSTGGRGGGNKHSESAASAALSLVPSPSSSAAQLPKQAQTTPSPLQGPPLPLPLALRPDELLFVAPEALRDPGALLASPPADVFAFGMLLWALAAAQTSWDSELMLLEGGVAATAVEVAAFGSTPGSYRPRPIPAWPSGAHPQLQNLYLACVSAVPEQRPSMDQVVSELEQLDEGLRNDRPKTRAAAAASYAALAAAGLPRGESGFIPGFML
ncbi:hypothetical protein VaNZ11_006137 [Volvox africanus]|uniref:Protein kinase domain-containing protein n=1 Tax=Volvox africanus TaxID=51714 RepID=A0ABQ5S032_9CHLO|nr:hypothetical protein VaNZ11_006137 [Volvox africanus]